MTKNKIGVPDIAAKRWAALAAMLTVIIVLVVRAFLLSRYSSSLPSWDAWGAEAAPLYTPWINGQFQWSSLWAWHNEHRILFTRVLDMLLFVANDLQWDVRVQTMASSILFATITGMSTYWLLRNVEFPFSLLLSAVTVLTAVLPGGWANTYQGFQSCFYFVLLFSLLTVRAAAHFRFSLGGGFVLAMMGLASVFSLAAGVLATIAGVCVVFARIWLERVPLRRALPFGLPLLLIAIWSLLDARKGEIHPATMIELVRAFAIMMSWPFVSFVGILLWLPAIAVLIRIVRQRSAQVADLVFGGLSVWVLLICAAAAWTRAYNFIDVQSRYTDLLIPSFVAQIYFAFRCAGLVQARQPFRVVSRFGGVAFAGLSVAGLHFSSMSELWKWREYDFMTRIGATHVRAYLDGDSTALEGHPHGYIPYPEPGPLADVLDVPTVRSYLPLSVASMKQPAAIQKRSCRWTSDRGTQLPHGGQINCKDGDIGLSPESELSVGPLSAFTYAIWQRIGRQRYSRLMPDPASSTTVNSANCALDQINGVPVSSEALRVPYADVIRVTGWLGPQPIDLSTPAMRLILDGGKDRRYTASETAGIPRPEVTRLLNSHGYELSGFNVIFDGSAVPAGTYAVVLANSLGAECRLGIALVIENDADIRLAY